MLKEINSDIDINSLNNLKESQIWAFISNNSSQTINEFKSQLKNTNNIINELSKFNEEMNEKEEINKKKIWERKLKEKKK